MLDTGDLALWYALNRLVTNYWADVDDEGGSHAHEFYTPKACYSVGNNRFDGADRIRAFYTRRRLDYRPAQSRGRSDTDTSDISSALQ